MRKFVYFITRKKDGKFFIGDLTVTSNPESAPWFETQADALNSNIVKQLAVGSWEVSLLPIDIPEERHSIFIVAVVFRNMISNSMVRLSKTVEKPYYYLDIHGLKEGDIALVHNGDNFGVVEVKRVIPPTQATALARVTKPVLCKLNYDEELLLEAAEKLKQFRDATKTARIDIQIDQDLGLISSEVAGQRLASIPYEEKKERKTAGYGERRSRKEFPGDIVDDDDDSITF